MGQPRFFLLSRSSHRTLTVSRPFKFYLLKLLSHLGSLLVGALLFLERRLFSDKARIYSQALGLIRQPFFQLIREFGIKHNRYVNYSVALVGEITIRFLSNLAQESVGSYPEFTEHLTRAWYVLDHSSHSQSPPPTHPSYLQTPSFIPHPISSCSELFQLTLCYS